MDPVSLLSATRSMAHMLTSQAYWMQEELRRMQPPGPDDAEYAEAWKLVDHAFLHFYFDGQDELEWMDRRPLLPLDPDERTTALRQRLAGFLGWMDAELRPLATFAQRVGPDGGGSLVGMVVYTGVGEMLKERAAYCERLALIGITAQGLID